MTYMPPASPANIDASVTSLSAGSLTTVARADHIHTLSKVPVLIASTTLASNQSSISFTNIPQGYKHLHIICAARSSTTSFATEDLMIRLNGDSGSNYIWSTSTLTYLWFSINTAITYPTSGNIVFASSSAILWNYSNNATGVNSKLFSGFGTYNNSTSSWQTVTYFPYALWNNTSAVTSISFTPLGLTNLIAGSSIQLYGIP